MIASALNDPEHDIIDFLWHGGEPTILPISYYEKAMMVQSRFQRPGQIVMNSIQTNGTGITDSWAIFLRKNHFLVGISLDGPPEIHDNYRLYASGIPSSKDIYNSIRLLQEYKVPFSVLMVMDEGSLQVGPDRIFEFFLEMKIKRYGFLAATPINQPEAKPGTPTNHYVNPKRMNDFLIKFYDCWKAYGDPEIKVREFEAIFQRINNQKSLSCTLQGNCFGRYYIVEPNGDVAHCELFQGDSRYTVGNLLEDDFKSFRESDRMQQLTDHNQIELEGMKSCPEFSTCNGWCPHERYLAVRHDSSYNKTCCGLYDLISHIRNHMPRFVLD